MKKFRVIRREFGKDSWYVIQRRRWFVMWEYVKSKTEIGGKRVNAAFKTMGEALDYIDKNLMSIRKDSVKS